MGDRGRDRWEKEWEIVGWQIKGWEIENGI